MKLQRFFIETLEFVKGDSHKIILKDKNLLNQILNVFRFRVGAQFIIFDGSGTEFLVEILESNKKEIIGNIKEEKKGLQRNKKLTLVFSMIKKENMELLVQKCTEVGVTSFFPVISERTVKTGWNYERMERIVKEAVEQSGFSDMPVVQAEPIKLEKLLEKFKKEKENLDGLAVLDLGGVSLASLKHLISVDTIFVGPEGGWTDKEREIFKKYNLKSISVGGNTLRAETACIAVASIFLL
jgi:16S rRNA (uracil1498-N3)-methyltransferase